MRNTNTYTLGLMGEDRALDYLQAKGMVLLERRYHSPYGEIDLVLMDGGCLVLAEVKARSTQGRGAGSYALTASKQRKLILTARHYLAAHSPDCPVRFDLVEITTDGIEHIENAFEA